MENEACGHKVLNDSYVRFGKGCLHSVTSLECQINCKHGLKLHGHKYRKTFVVFPSLLLKRDKGLTFFLFHTCHKNAIACIKLRPP